VKIARFLWRRLRRYSGWMMVAFAAILTFAVATALLASLIEPIFGEVLLTEGGLPFGMGSGNDQVAPPPASADGVDSDVAVADGSDAPNGGALSGDGGLPDWLSAIDLQAWFDRGYEGLKRRLGVAPAQVVYFVPLLFVTVFLLRSIADFLSGYAFQRLGLPWFKLRTHRRCTEMATLGKSRSMT
jgi:hypothetical protein